MLYYAVVGAAAEKSKAKSPMHKQCKQFIYWARHKHLKDKADRVLDLGIGSAKQAPSALIMMDVESEEDLVFGDHVGHTYLFIYSPPCV